MAFPITVTYTFGTQTGAVPLSYLDTNFSNITTGVNAISSGGNALVTPVLGTPTSGTLTNCTGYTVGNISGLGTGVGTWLATPSSANLLSAMTDETGTGLLVFGTSPTLTTPVISGGTINNASVGATTASTGVFTQLTVNGANLNTAISPTGTGTVTINPVGALTINPTAASTINNASIGQTTPLAGSFTALSATSNVVTSVTAATSGLTANTPVASTLTYTTGGITLATQTAAAGSVWRVRAYGQFVAATSATARNAQIACFWGTTQLTAITPAVVISVAQTTGWVVEFELTATSTTAIWTTGILTGRLSSATVSDNYMATAASTTVTAGAQTLDLRVSSSVVVAGDSWTVQQVTIERLK